MRGRLSSLCLAFFLLPPLWFAGVRQPATEQELAELKQRMVVLVNADRARFGLRPVEYDPLASAIGDIFCRHALEQGVTGHYLLDGYSPFHRYSLWGRSPHFCAENVCCTSHKLPVVWTKEEIWNAMVRHEQTMLAEKPPNDGHRRNILDPWHTHLGVGIAYSSNGLRVVQEFLNKYAAVQRIPQRFPLGQPIPFSGRLLEPEKYEVAGVWVFFDPTPRPLTADEANAKDSYGYPADRLYLRPKLPPNTFYKDDGGRGEVELGEGGWFSVTVPQFANKPGIYGLMLRLCPREDKTKQFPATFFCIEVPER